MALGALIGAETRGMQNSSAETIHKLRAVLIFAIHQFIAALGVAVAAAILIPFTFDLLRSVNPRLFTSHNAHFLLTKVPYFPMQIILAFWSGWSFYLRYRHRAMLWVWVLPLLVLCYAVMVFPILMPNQTSIIVQAAGSQSALSHYFGRGCSMEVRCEDQLLITMPLYSSVSYSIGALIARKIQRNAHLARDQRPSANPL